MTAELIAQWSFVGGHTQAIFRYGIQDLLPANVEFVHGPGCPVCVLPIGRIDNAIELAEQHQVILCIYADLLRVPASQSKSLLKAKAAGADIRMIYSTQDALKIAQQNLHETWDFLPLVLKPTPPTVQLPFNKHKLLSLKKLFNFL